MKRSIWLIKKIIPVVALVLLCFTFGCQQPVEEAITEEEAKALLDRYVEIWNEGNLTIVEEVFDPEYVLHHCAFPEDIVGLDGFKSWTTSSLTAFPDHYITFDEMIVKGDKIVMRWTATGTNTGTLVSPLGELPPTGKKFRISGLDISRVVNGKIAEEWLVYNLLDMLQQLGFTLTPPQVEKPQ
ncbi:MAG: ester cyclase [Acidobacteriota bacterium]